MYFELKAHSHQDLKKGDKTKLRTSKSKFRPRTVVVSTRLTSSEAKSLKAIARRQKQNRSVFTRNALLNYIG